MGAPQSGFLAEFKAAFESRFGAGRTPWSGGQSVDNCAAFLSPYPCRRAVGTRLSERFELGDAAILIFGFRIVVEFESKELPLSNILKYWPYIRGELDAKPEVPILICHFSDWWSYATRRDLWEWTLARMQDDSERRVDIAGKQFDHGGVDASLRAASIADAIDWIALMTQKNEADNNSPIA